MKYLFNVLIDQKSLKGPDFELLEQISSMGLGTPVIYSGGIRSVDDARSY